MVEHRPEKILGGETQNPKEDSSAQLKGDYTQQIIDVQNQQIQTGNSINQIIDGVDLLAVQVTTLNERVYTKNYLDRVRNLLLAGFIVTAIVIGSLLVLLLHYQVAGDEKRAKEAIQSRRQIADCTVKPGVVLDEGYVNPGECYKEGATRTGEAVNKITVDIKESVRQLLIEQREKDLSNK